MKLKQQVEFLNSQIGSLSSQNDVLAARVNVLTVKKENLEKELTQAGIQQSKVESEGLADRVKIAQLKKQLSVINHITAGRANEAIQEILTPMPVLFALDVRFADDKSRIAAEDETLEKLKKVIIASVNGVAINRDVQGRAVK